MEKRNNILGVMLIIVIVLLVMLIVLILYNTQIFNNTNEKETSKVETSLSGDNTTNTNTATAVNEVKTVTVEKSVCPIFDISKSKKVQNGYKYTGEISYNNGMISHASINTDGTVTVNFLSNENNKNYVVQGLSGKVIDISCGSYGDGASAYMVFLMADGTVEISSELNDSYQSGIIKSTGKVIGLTSNITRIEHVVSILDSSERKVTRLTFVAIDDKGYFYDLFTF
ncbi:MAG: hypothetical protein PHD15_05875 [Clostridia bacterium]|nr:hypothetical protein [Clostridia bacterium]MDD4387260.1 hypothetical protein [Clostridia bacterium]